MCVRYLGCVLLLWFPAALHASLRCSPPSLDGGYFVPVQESYSNGTNLSYSCDKGRKPAAEGWWATSTCENGTWTPKLQCIDENNCIPPNIPNAKYTEDSNGSKIKIICDKGYEPKNNHLMAQCINGTWSSVPICEKSTSACGHPPKIPHAVIIKQKYQEVFADNSNVEYECEEGYTTVDGQTKKSIYCKSGVWNDVPTCTSSTSSGSFEIEAEHRRAPINNCGKPPSIQNGDIVETHQMFLKYQCNNYYSLVGSEKVECYSNGKWSKVPACIESYCTLNTEEYSVLKPDGVKYIKYGETEILECESEEYWFDNFSVVQCTRGRLTLSRCCNKAQIKLGTC